MITAIDSPNAAARRFFTEQQSLCTAGKLERAGPRLPCMVHGHSHRPVTMHVEKQPGDGRNPIMHFHLWRGLHPVHETLCHPVRHSRGDLEPHVRQSPLRIVTIVHSEPEREVLLQTDGARS